MSLAPCDKFTPGPRTPGRGEPGYRRCQPFSSSIPHISSKGIADAESFGKAARSHWGVENRLALRKFALSLLRQDDQHPKRNLRSRRKTADRILDYRASLLGLDPLG